MISILKLELALVNEGDFENSIWKRVIVYKNICFKYKSNNSNTNNCTFSMFSKEEEED